MSEEMKMSELFPKAFEVPHNKSFEVQNCHWVTFGEDFHSNCDQDDAIAHAVLNHDRLVEENARLTELAAQKASRADELYSRLDKSQMLINSVGLIFMNDTLTAKEKEKQLKSLFDIHGDDIYLNNRELLDKIKQESNDE